MRCECEPCDYGNNGGRCAREAADHGDVVTSPALCTACLFGCGADDDESWRDL